MDTRTALPLPSTGHAGAIISGHVFRGRLNANVVRDALHAVIKRYPALAGRVRRDTASPTNYVLAVPSAFSAQEPVFLETYSATLASLSDTYPLALHSPDITLTRRPTFAERAAIFSPSPDAPVKLRDYLDRDPPSGGRKSTPILYLHVGQYSDGLSVVGLRYCHAALDGVLSGVLRVDWSMAMRDPTAYAEATSRLVKGESPTEIINPFACFLRDGMTSDAGAQTYGVCEPDTGARFSRAATQRRSESAWLHNRLLLPVQTVKLLTAACNATGRSTFGLDAFVSSGDVMSALLWQAAMHRRRDPNGATALVQLLDVRSRCPDLPRGAFGNLAAHAFCPSPLLAAPSLSPPSLPTAWVSSAPLPVLARTVRLSLSAWTPAVCRSVTRWRLETAARGEKEMSRLEPEADYVSVTNRSKLGRLCIDPGPALMSGSGECTHRFAVGVERSSEANCFTIQESTDGLHFEIEGVARPESWAWVLRSLSRVHGGLDELGRDFVAARL